MTLLAKISWVGTVVFTATAVPAALSVTAFELPAAIVSLVLFGLGIIAFLWAFFVAVNRSRTDAIGMGGLYFLAGSAPKSVQYHFLASLAVQIIVGFATASMRPFTSLAFGILVSMFGLGVSGLWGAKFGEFTPRSTS